MAQSTILIQNETETVLQMCDNFDGTFNLSMPQPDGIAGNILTKQEAEKLRDYLIKVLD